MESVLVRQDIVDAATRVFSSKGYHGSSMQDIADHLGMRKSSLYHHVRKKEDLLFAIHDALIEMLTQQTTEALAVANTPEEKLRSVLQAAMRFMASNREGVTVFLEDRGLVDGARWNDIVSKRDAYEALVTEVVDQGIAAGHFIPLPSKIVTRGVLAMCNWSYTWFNADGPMSADEIADVFAEMVVSGLHRR